MDTPPPISPSAAAAAINQVTLEDVDSGLAALATERATLLALRRVVLSRTRAQVRDQRRRRQEAGR